MGIYLGHQQRVLINVLVLDMYLPLDNRKFETFLCNRPAGTERQEQLEEH